MLLVAIENNPNEGNSVPETSMCTIESDWSCHCYTASYSKCKALLSDQIGQNVDVVSAIRVTFNNTF